MPGTPCLRGKMPWRVTAQESLSRQQEEVSTVAMHSDPGDSTNDHRGSVTGTKRNQSIELLLPDHRHPATFVMCIGSRDLLLFTGDAAGRRPARMECAGNVQAHQHRTSQHRVLSKSHHPSLSWFEAILRVNQYTHLTPNAALHTRHVHALRDTSMLYEVGWPTFGMALVMVGWSNFYYLDGCLG